MDAPPPEADPGRTPGWSDVIQHWRLAQLDLRRSYGIDLTDPAVIAGPWSRIRPYLLGTLTDPSSLVSRSLEV